MDTKVPYESIIQTSRLQLKSYNESDAARLHQLIIRNIKRLSLSFPNLTTLCSTPESTKAFIFLQRKEWMENARFSFGIYYQNSLVGHIFLKSIDWHVLKTEVGYFIDTDFEGQGIITEALMAVIDFAFNKMDLQKVFLRVIPGNEASARVALKCGFRKEGLLRKEFKTIGGVLLDVEYYGRLSTD